VAERARGAMSLTGLHEGDQRLGAASDEFPDIFPGTIAVSMTETMGGD
jgi:hypothetical protein